MPALCGAVRGSGADGGTPAPPAGLASLALLQELWLGRNRIGDVGEGLAALRSLKRLSLQSNRLTSMAGLQHCTALEELYLRCVCRQGRRRCGCGWGGEGEGPAANGWFPPLPTCHSWCAARVLPGRPAVPAALSCGRPPPAPRLLLPVSTPCRCCPVAAGCSHNGIEQLEGLGALVNLKILDVANNRIRTLEGLDSLQAGAGRGAELAVAELAGAAGSMALAPQAAGSSCRERHPGAPPPAQPPLPAAAPVCLALLHAASPCALQMHGGMKLASMAS